MKNTFMAMIGLSLAGSCLLPGSVAADTVKVSGEAVLENEYNSNVFHTKNDEVSEWQSQLNSTLRVEKGGAHGAMSAFYSPELSYNHRRDSGETTHNLGVNANFDASKHVHVSVADSFSYYDNLFHEAAPSLSYAMQFLRADSQSRSDVVRLLFPELSWSGDEVNLILGEIDQRYAAATTTVQEEVDRLLNPTSSGESRKRYWENDFSVQTVMEIAEESSITVGYAHGTLDNRTGTSSDNENHSPSIALKYKINDNWRLAADYNYEIQSYDQTDDSVQQAPSLSFTYQPLPQVTYSGGYHYTDMDYEGTTGNYQEQIADISYDRSLSETVALAVGGNLRYLARDVQADERGVDVALSLSRSFATGSYGLSEQYGHDESNVAGSWNKVRRSVQFGIFGTRQLSERLSCNGKVDFARDLNWNLGALTENDDLSFGAGVNYMLTQWLHLSLSYEYQIFDTSSANIDDYSNHQIVMTLSANHELLHW